MNNETKKAIKAVTDYAIRYASNRGLIPMFPRLVVGMMAELPGWPVRNADGGANIAYFSSLELAERSISDARRVFSARFSKHWSEQ